jgi:hypothetical protein
MTTIYWDYHGPREEKWFELTLFNPSPALPEIIKSRDTTHVTHFTKCPAFKEYYKNTYVIKSPVDITITYDKETKVLSIKPQAQVFYDSAILYRGDTVGNDDAFLMSFNVNYLFIADKDCMLEFLPASMHSSDFIDMTRLVNGTFNINKWYRPVEVAFEIKNPSFSIKIKRGDPLAYVRFIPADGGKVNVEQKHFPQETLDAVSACLYVKASNNFLPLKTLYELSTRLKNKLWFNKKKCPFNWRNK